VTTQGAVAEHFGVTARTVRVWLKKAGFPAPVGGVYDLEAIADWRDERSGRTDKWVAKRREFQAKREQLRYEVARGELVRAEHVYRVVTQHIVEARTLLLTLPDQVQVLVDPDCRGEVTRKVRAVVHSALKALADGQGRLPGGKKKGA